MSAETTSAASLEPPWLLVRREPFDYGLLPLSSLIINEGVPAFKALRGKLLEQALPVPISTDESTTTEDGGSQGKFSKNRVNSAGIAASLDLPETHAHLLLETLASVLPDEGADVDPLACKPVAEIESIGADIDDVVLFLYIQTFKKVLPRPHKDAVAVSDVWPTPSVFDGFLSPTSLLQARASRRSLPCQAEEEAHQLAFIQKHLLSILSLLAQSTESIEPIESTESTEDGDQDAKVITLEKFQHLSFLLRAGDATADMPLNQATPFFANSDPAMPAVPVPLPQVLDWMLEHLCSASERNTLKSSTKENGPAESEEPEADVPMPDASPYGGQSSGAVTNGLTPLPRDWRPEGITFVDGVTRASVVKREADIKGGSVKVTQCHDSVVYVLGPMKYASVYGCSDSIVVLGAVGKAVRVEHCERVQIIVPCARICIANCRECLFNLGVNQRPVVLGDNHNLQVAPYNTFYPELESDLQQVGVDSTVNKWDQLLPLGMVDPHDSISHSAGAADAKGEGAAVLQPEKFTTFAVPKWGEVDSQEELVTQANPFILPKAYLVAQQQRTKAVESLKQTLKGVALEESRKRDLTTAIHAYFKEWLYSTGNIRQIYDLQVLERDAPKAMD